MDYDPGNLPDICAATGLECSDCVRGNARAVAAVCTDLVGITLERTFFQMYDHPWCATGLAVFQHAYHEAVGRPMRKPAAVARACAA